VVTLRHAGSAKEQTMTQQQMPPSPQGPICQSCSMPLAAAEDFGMEADGSRSQEYCHYCYEDGSFTSDMSMQGMIEISAKAMSETAGTPEQEARELLASVLPTLKRWRAA
jgi:hypothetical protein